MSYRFEITGGICLAIFMVTASWLLAKAGHPTSVWLWRDLLGLLP
jgi:hypothetical protein